jgi:hypothetical protein
MTDDNASPDDFDVVLPFAPTDDAAGSRVLRLRPGGVSTGEVRPLEEGKPMMGGELVRLERREGAPMLYDVKVEYKAPAPAVKGPAQVATEAYRTAWDRTFRTPPS